MTSTVDDRTAVGGVRTGILGPALLVGAVVASAPLYLDGFQALVSAWSTPEYSHGPIIPLISTFLFLREMRHVPPAAHPVTDRWPGFLVLLLGLAIGLLGNVVNIDQIVIYGFMIWITGIVLISFGFRRGILFWPALVHLIFMLPLPQFMYWHVSTYLQSVSSQIGVMIISFLNIPVFLDGNIIDLGVYKLQVAEACSGLRYLFPMLSFSYVFAILYQGPVWHKLLMLATAAPITVIMNSFRIGVIGILVNYFGIEQAEGFLHTFEGWIIFIACILILFGIAAILQRLTPEPKPLSQALDIEFEGLGRQFGRFTAVAPSIALALGAAATLAAGGLWRYAPERVAPDIGRSPFVVFPQQFGDWVGAPNMLDRQIEDVLGADDYYTANYVNKETGASVDFFSAYYEDQKAGKGIHSPEVCLPAGGWEVSDWEAVTVAVPGEEPFLVNRAIIQKGTVRQLVYFWFEQQGRRLRGSYAAKGYTVWDSAMRGRTDGGIVRVITPIGAAEPVESATARLTTFLSYVVPKLRAFIPE